jgi:pimeloyl-ACP methyl ester carboxylesterase
MTRRIIRLPLVVREPADWGFPDLLWVKVRTPPESLDDIPVVIGHSLGGLIAQQLAVRCPAKALILLSPNAPWGVLPTADEERAVAVGLMSAGPFWKDVMHLDLDLEAGYAVNMFPPDEQPITR